MDKPGKYTIVLWEDPASEYDGWQSIKSFAAKEPELVFSIGWLVRDDPTHLYLAMDWHSAQCNTVGKIPKAAVKWRKSVKIRWPKAVVDGV